MAARGSMCGLLALLTLLGRVDRGCRAATSGCYSVRYAYNAQGFDSGSVPSQPLPGDHLRICQQGQTCCTEEMEENFNLRSQQEFGNKLNETTNLVKQIFSMRAVKFDDFFKELLKKSKQNFHQMFIKTYGALYEQNSHVFTDLFDSLEKYYRTGNVNLMDALDGFFTTLYQKMFQVLNAQYTFDQKYLTCVGEMMEGLQPFGDVPQKLNIQVKRAFVAARTFVQGLAVGRDVTKNIMKIPTSAECNRAIMKMTYCHHCQGLPDLKACNNYCLNVMKGCLAYHAELNDEWNNYIDSLLLLADRLEGPFNIESVVEPINIKISDAIMNFQENGPEVSTKVFNDCGQPRLGKRSVNTELTFDTLKFGRPENGPRPITAAGTSLDRLVRDIRSKVKVAKNFWTNIPYQICNNDKLAANPGIEDDCWNGLTKAKYEVQIMGDGVDNQINNPEVNLDINRPNSIVNQQVLSLRIITTKLKNAYNGLDVDWPDSESGFGSGSGSGDGDGDDFGSGAGQVTRSDVSFPNEPDIPSSSVPPPRVKEATPPPSSGSTPTKRMTINRAVNIFVLPIMLMWLGSMF